MPMQLVCPHCSQVLEIAGAPPAFCAYCGKALSRSTVVPPTSTGEPYSPDAPTLAPVEDETTVIGAAPPQVLGRYRLLRSLGSGGMGTVYEAEDTTTGRRVALKLVAPEFAASKETVERFRREGRLASGLTHPRCVFVFGADEADGRPFIVMELMTGDTLKDLVEKEGPLPPVKAITKMLDVIEGLQEAHKREVIHRDVKPSNCFLEADGRVKVGDFGLAKSLVNRASGDMTKTGLFLGTPHFASPEQVRAEPLDQQTDVYSVAATLYYLLTGRPPFHGGDATSTLARIVADPPPSMRKVRPDLPQALDRVVLKGLERDKKKRYQDLEELKQALLAFIPRKLSISGVGIRLGAILVDYVVLYVLLFTLAAVIALVAGNFSPDHLVGQATGPLFLFSASLMWILYFAIPEGLHGASLGKQLLRLRVARGESNDPPGLLRALNRTVVWFACVLLPSVLVELLFDPEATHFVALTIGLPLVGTALLAVSMRAANGYRGLHDLASDTRILQLPWPRKRAKPLSTLGWFLYLKRSRRLSGDSSKPDAVPQQIGGFAIRGALRLSPEEKVVLGEDTTLSRKVAIVLRPASAPPISEVRRNVPRATRPRWLACGKLRNEQWDAFLAPGGCPLPELIASEKQLSWAEVRPILEQLVEEFEAALAEGTLPPVLSLDQIWVQHDAGVQLTDLPPDNPASMLIDTTVGPAEGQVLALLRELVVLTLEGKQRTAEESLLPIRAPLPEHARRIVDRLIVGTTRYSSLRELTADLASSRDQPVEIDASLRAGHLALQASILVPILLLMFLAGFVVPSILGAQDDPIRHVADYTVQEADGDLLISAYAPVAWATIATAAVFPFLCVIWCFLAGGSVSGKVMGIGLVRGDGRPASRAQCSLRILLCWAPIVLLLIACFWWPTWTQSQPSFAGFQVAWLVCWAVILVLVGLYVVLALTHPRQALHDRFAGTYLEPM